MLKQDYQDFTIFISDNASTDNTKETVAGFNDKRIKYYRHEQNVGMQRNWIFCLSNVDTQYIAFLEDDNHFLPNHLCEANTYLNKSNIGFYFCNSRFNDSFYTTAFSTLTERQLEDLDICELLIDINIPASGVVFKTSLVKEINFSATIDLWCMDRFFWRSIILKTGFIFNPSPNIVYVVHDNNITYSLLKNRQAKSKASLQNRFVDAYTILHAIRNNKQTAKRFIQSIKKRSPDSYKHIIACFYGIYNNRDFTQLGKEVVDIFFTVKYPHYTSFLNRFYSSMLFKNTNYANKLISGYSITNIVEQNNIDENPFC